jgi:hypothetical protein
MRQNPLSSARRRLLAHALGLALAGAALADADAHARGAASAPRRQPDGWTVVTIQNCDDSGPGSLRDAMLAATLNTELDLDDLACAQITLTTGALADTPAAHSVRLHRTPALVAGRKHPTLSIQSATMDRVIDHEGTGGLYVEGVEMSGGMFYGDYGGCLYSQHAISLDGVILTGCQLISPANAYALGGGAYAKGNINVAYSTITGCDAFAATGYAYGGGLFAAGDIALSYSTLSFNRAHYEGYGGGLAARGSVGVRNSLVTGNVAIADGAMLLVGSVGTPVGIIDNSTVAYNSADVVGGIASNAEIRVYSSTIAHNSASRADIASGITTQGNHPLTLVSSIVALNDAGGQANDVGGSGTVSGHSNLVTASALALPPDTITDDPVLGALADNGGQTMTMPLLPGSPAIDAGYDVGHFYCDQRGGELAPSGGFLTIDPRGNGAAPDIGAFETGAGDRLFRDGFDGGGASTYTCFMF